MLNRIHGSISYPLVLTASYLMGHGDSWFPMPVTHIDPWPHSVHVRQLHSTACDAAAGSSSDPAPDECPASPAPGYDDDNTAVDLTTTADGKFCAVGPKANFLARHDALSDWSFVETEMAYDCGVIRSQHARMLALQGDHPKAGLYGHSARTAAAMCLPQFIREFPLMPAEQAPPDEREAWAAFALGAFFPYDRKLSVLQGSSLWEKVAFWRANKPRGDFDTFAWRCLDNIQERSCTVLAPN